MESERSSVEGAVGLVHTRHAHDDDPGKRGCGNGLVKRREGVIARDWHETSLLGYQAYHWTKWSTCYLASSVQLLP